MSAAPAWTGRSQWRVLQAGFDDAAFQALLQAWRADPSRPRLLHWVAIDATPPGDRPGLTPGMHRFSFEQGQVLLTLCVGELQAMLREQSFRADAVRLRDLSSATLKALPRLCRRGTAIVWDRFDAQPGELTSVGFVASAHGAQYAPAWQVKGLADATEAQPTDCVVIGGGLAGAAAAASLARRGWRVQVLDAAAEPAAGASGLPAGLLAPHQSPDDNLLSRLSRAGVRLTWDACTRLLAQGTDWSPTGVLEHRGADRRPVPPVADIAPWTRFATDAEKDAAGWPRDDAGWWHQTAGWVRPAALVRAWLATSGVTWRGGCDVHALEREGEGEQWLVRDATGAVLARTPLVVVAAAGGTARLLGARVPVHPVRGQVAWNLREHGDALPPFPLNGNGHFLPDVPLAGGRAWLTGSTYGRADADVAPRDADHAANLERLRGLAPAAAERLASQFAEGRVRAWSNVRWTSTDRRPFAGQLEPGLWVSTAMGSRGLTFAALCGEWIAARLHDEPWPLEARLGQALDVARQRPAAPAPGTTGA